MLLALQSTWLPRRQARGWHASAGLIHLSMPSCYANRDETEVAIAEKDSDVLHLETRHAFPWNIPGQYASTSRPP